jgi:hypothetical protein
MAPPADTPSTLFLRGLAFLARAAVLLLRPYWPPPRPGRFTFTSTQEVTPMGVQFKVFSLLPALPVPNEVAQRELTPTVSGTAMPAVLVDPTAADFLVGQFDVGVQGSVSLVDIDAAGNRSDPRVETFTVSDTIPPPAPGEFGFRSEQVLT